MRSDAAKGAFSLSQTASKPTCLFRATALLHILNCSVLWFSQKKLKCSCSTKPHFTFSILSWEHWSFVNCHHSKSLRICGFYLNFVKSLLNVRSEYLLFPATSVNHGDWITLKIAFFFCFILSKGEESESHVQGSRWCLGQNMQSKRCFVPFNIQGI